jgi:signal transduction histidine kinase/ActR/RegA family two-component response regulator
MRVAMTAAELVRYLTYALFLVVFISVARSALRERNRSSLDTTLLFGAIALVIAQSQISTVLGVRSGVLSVVSLLLLLALPYLQLRLVEDFAGVRPVVMRLCAAGIAVAAVAAVVASLGVVDLTAAAGPLVGVAVLYFFGFGTYAALGFAREARRSGGIARQRMALAAGGSLSLSLVLLVAVAAQLIAPALSSAATMILAFISATAFAAAFAPPAILRRAWREPALRSFFSSAAAISPLESRADIVAKLEAGAARATSARAANVVMWEGDHPQATERAGDRPLPTEVLRNVFSSQRPQLAVDDSRAVLVAPITGRGRQLGVLAITGRRAPLFASDDLDLVQVLADQAAVVLDGARLYEELAAANRELSEATRVKSEFLANMSHELRTPLNAILGFSGLLTEQIGASLTDRQRRFLHNIEEAGQHLLELINDVLDLSKVEAGKLELRPEVIALDALLEPVCAAARASAQSKGITFEVQTQASEGLLLDPTRVRQVLFNLVSNAVKFTPSGGRVHLRALLKGPDLLVAVADTGIGIPADARSRVFGVFERLHEGRVKTEGTGLGLALTKRLVEQMGGSIAFESQDGEGTTFRVCLPDVRTEPVLGQRILIVEDERHDADLIVAVAGSLGLRAEVVRSLAATSLALRRSRPLAIVLDLHLLDGRGEQVLRDLRDDAINASVPVIVVTVEAEPSPVLALGADDYLTKPIDRARLELWLMRACGVVVPQPVVVDRREHAHSSG